MPKKATGRQDSARNAGSSAIGFTKDQKATVRALGCTACTKPSNMQIPLH